MRVRADDQVAARQMPAFGHDLVTDAVADVVEHRAMLVRECAHVAMHVGRFDIRRRRVMVENDRGFGSERQREFIVSRADLLDHLQRVRRACIVQHRKIDTRDDDIPGAYRFAAGVRSQYLLGDCVTHPSSGGAAAWTLRVELRRDV